MDQHIREYRDSDYEACRSLWVELTERHRTIYDDPAIGGTDPAQGFDAYVRNPNRHATWVAEVGGAVAGMCGLLVHGEEAEVEPLVISVRHRSRGMGRVLVDQAVREARRLGVRFLSVRPVARNREAIVFFAGCGFDLVGQIDLFQDLQPERGREWKPGLVIHGRALRY